MVFVCQDPELNRDWSEFCREAETRVICDEAEIQHLGCLGSGQENSELVCVLWSIGGEFSLRCSLCPHLNLNSEWSL